MRGYEGVEGRVGDAVWDVEDGEGTCGWWREGGERRGGWCEGEVVILLGGS